MQGSRPEKAESAVRHAFLFRLIAEEEERRRRACNDQRRRRRLDGGADENPAGPPSERMLEEMRSQWAATLEVAPDPSAGRALRRSLHPGRLSARRLLVLLR